jgi:hypothetical protein
MFNELPKTEFRIVSSTGDRRGVLRGVYSGDVIMTDDISVHLKPGDELRRSIPNGEEETFEVLDQVRYESSPVIPAHLKVQVNFKGASLADAGPPDGTASYRSPNTHRVR